MLTADRRRLTVALVLLAVLPSCRLAVCQQRGVDIQAYHFAIDIPDSGNVITGLATVYYRPLRGYDDTLRLDLVGMSVRRVFDVVSMRALPFRYDSTVLRIATRGGGAYRSRRGVVVEYSGAPRDGLIIKTNARGRRSAFGDNWPNRARYWLPTVDHPSDKARVLWSIRVPRGWSGVANQPECRPPGRRADCIESAPIPTYTMVLGATEMVRSVHRPAEVDGQRTPIVVWAYPEDSAFADSVPFARATEIVETLSRLVGPYPYTRLSHVQSSTRYGAMENATAIFYDEAAYVRRTMTEGTVRHETAHQWFGDAVTPREWADLWLSEGFASYFDLVVGTALGGDSVLRRGMRANAQSWLHSDVIDRPMVDTVERDPNRLLNANVYPKGAWVLHMLRGVVGDSAFFRGVRDYYRLYRDSSVVSVQFQQVMERASRQDLGWFFGQWLYQPGHPRLDVQWAADTSGPMVRLTVRQVQSEAWGRWEIPAVPVAFLRRGEVVARRTFRLQARYREISASFMGIGPVDAVQIDPEGSLLLTAEVHPQEGGGR
jgi:aminopeptidase N